MKFLYFSFEMPTLLKDDPEIAGGSAVQWLSWIDGFLSNGHKFGLLTYKGAKTYINKKLDFDVVESYDPAYGIKKLRLFYFLPKLYQSVKKYNPDFIIQSSANNHLLPLLVVSKILGIPFIHRVTNDPHIDERLSGMISKRSIFFYSLGLRYSDFIIAQNNYQFNKLKEKYPNKNIIIIHNPFIIKKNISLSFKERKYIAWIGNFRYQKNLKALFEVASKLSDCNFKIAGHPHPNLDEETKDALKKLRNLKNVEFIGYIKRSDISNFFKGARVLLNTSRWEGFSNTFLEAWAAGVPVVTTKKVNPDEIVSKYNLGEVAEDFEHLPCSLKTIIDLDEEEYNKLALHCYEYVKENHNPKILAEKFVSYLKKDCLLVVHNRDKYI